MSLLYKSWKKNIFYVFHIESHLIETQNVLDVTILITIKNKMFFNLKTSLIGQALSLFFTNHEFEFLQDY